MKQMMIAMMAGLVLLGAGNVVAAPRTDDGYGQIVASWVEERDEVVVQIVYGWLREATPDSQKELLSRVVQLDVRMANEKVPLYVTSFKDSSDLEGCLRDVVRTYLKRNGVTFNTASFFEGRSFELIVN